MLHWVFIIFSLILSAFGLYAFIYIMMKGSGSSSVGGINLMTHDEFKGLPEEMKKLYKKTVLDIIVPSYSRFMNKVWEGLREEIDYASIESEAIDSAKKASELIDSIPVTDVVNEIVADYKRSKEGFASNQGTLATRLVNIVQKSM